MRSTARPCWAATTTSPPWYRRPEEPTMTLHRLTSVTMGVPNVAETAAYYTDFGLKPAEAAPGGSDGSGGPGDSGGEAWFSTRDGGRQLRIVPAPTRRLVDLHVGVDDADDLHRVAASLSRLGI